MLYPFFSCSTLLADILEALANSLMASLPDPVNRVIAALSYLPGLGPRSAERIALYLVQADLDSVKELAVALTEQQPCGICGDAKRDASLVCVVERAVDIVNIEKSGAYRGRYHVLGGKISPLNGIGPEDLRIGELQARLAREPIREIIIALPSDVEGDATSFYLAKLFTGKGITTSRLAHGLPVGSGLEFADSLTLGGEIEGRRPIE